MKYYINKLHTYHFNMYRKKNAYKTHIGHSIDNYLKEINTILFLRGIKLEENVKLEIPKDVFNIIKPYFYFWADV